MKKSFVGLIVLFMMIAILTACVNDASNSNNTSQESYNQTGTNASATQTSTPHIESSLGSNIDGTWEVNRRHQGADFSFDDTLIISGNSYTLIQQFPSQPSLILTNPLPSPEPGGLPHLPPPVWEVIGLNSPANSRSGLSYYWPESTNVDDMPEEAIFLRREPIGEHHHIDVYEVTINGSLSFTESQVEFILPGNRVRVFNFSFTENTLTLERDIRGDSVRLQYIRSGMNR